MSKLNRSQNNFKMAPKPANETVSLSGDAFTLEPGEYIIITKDDKGTDISLLTLDKRETVSLTSNKLSKVGNKKDIKSAEKQVRAIKLS
jgi:hypothetical protein